MRFPSLKKTFFGKPSFILSLLLGGIFGLSTYGYWLIDILPPTSRRIFFFTILSSLAGVIGYYFLLDLWIIPQFRLSQRVEKWKFVVWGTLLGSILMFAGTNAWTSDSRYLTFLLPNQSLEISAIPSQDEHTPQASVIWITTSLGDISYDALELNGWERDGDQLVLKDPIDNSIRWQGQTGRDTSIVFQKSPSSGDVAISWNEDTETIDLQGANGSTFLYEQQLKVPLYASIFGVSFVVLINFVVVGIALSILFFQYRSALDETITKAFGNLSYHNPRQDVIIVIGLLIFAFLLRIFNLENLYPYADEYLHLIAANEILDGAPLGEVYQRSLITVTLPVVASYQLFGVSLWAARFPGVLFNVLGIIPLYMIVRKINRPVAVTSGFLYATSPYLIAFSRNIRGYAVYPFYFYVVLYLMILFLDGFPERFSIFKDWKKIRPVQLEIIFFLALVAYYAFFFDVYSTFKIILVVYGVFALFLLMKFDIRDKWNWLTVIVSLFAVFFAMGSHLQRFLKLPKVNFQAMEYFFLNPPQQWYFDRIVVIPILALAIGFYFSRILFRKNFIPMLLFALYALYMLFYVFLFDAIGFTIHPRFVLTAHVWFVPVFAVGIYGVWMFLRSVFKSNQTTLYLSVIVLILFSFNPRQVLLSTFFRGELMPISTLVHGDMRMANSYLLVNVNEGDILVGSLYADYSQWQGNPVFDSIYQYSFTVLRNENKDGFSYITSVIEKHSSGWIVMDEQALDFASPSLPMGTIIVQGKPVEYVGKFQTQHVWHWSVE